MKPIETIADIPWPGPRPITFSDDDSDLSALVGRDKELVELRHLCRTYSVVELTAPSGVGKTSFLEGAKVHLEEHDFEVLSAPPWMKAIGKYEEFDEELTASHDPLPLYCLALGFDLPPGAGLSELRTAVRERNAEQRIVCVFDQLEELLRYERDLGANLLDLIGRIAAATSVPHVVVARTEFRDQLRPVEVQEAPTWHMLLSELSAPEVIREVVESPVPEEVELEEGVAERIVEWWESARLRSRGARLRDSPYSGGAEFGLLHLQALLLDLQGWAVDHVEDKQRLTLGDLEGYARARSGDAGPDSGAALMSDALYRYVEKSISKYEGDVWSVGPRLMLARAAGHLSSAGFKVAQPFSVLVTRAIQEELGSSKSGLDAQGHFDIESKEGRRKAADFFVGHFQIERAGVGREKDDRWVAEEMVAALQGVLKELARDKGPNILKHYHHGGDSIYELVHDGVAPALDRWAQGVLRDPIAFLGSICVRRGEIFDHNLSARTFLDEKGEVKPGWARVEARELDSGTAASIEGIGWHGLGVHHLGAEEDEEAESVEIEDVVFDSCDFTGTLFRNVVFRNVRFEDCAMRGVAMIGCCFENVVFERSELIGTAINKSVLRGVTFDCAGKEGAMNYVSIEEAKPDAEVSIRNLENTAGVFLVGLQGGNWSFDNVNLSYLAFEGKDANDLLLRLGSGSKLLHAKIDIPRASLVEEGAVVENPTGAAYIIASDAFGDGAATPS